jgi:hypothetical protein
MDGVGASEYGIIDQVLQPRTAPDGKKDEKKEGKKDG